MKYRSITAIAALGFLAAIQAACTMSADPTSSNNLSKGLGGENSASSNSGGGNGDFYGGKPDPGLYVRHVPDLGCGIGNENLAEILVSSDGAKAKFVDPSNCSVSRRDLSHAELEFIAYNPGRLSMSEGIFTKDDTIGAPASKKLAEVWCREESSTSVEGFDVLVFADYERGEYQASVIAGKLDADGKVTRSEYTHTNFTRIISNGDELRYRAGKFDLEVWASTFDPAKGTMIGKLEYETNGFNTEMNLNCRLGAQMDVHSPTRPYTLAVLREAAGALFAIVFKSFFRTI